MATTRFTPNVQAPLVLFAYLATLWSVSTARACEYCPVSIDSRPTVVSLWTPGQVEVCEVLAIPEVQEITHSLWGLGVAVDDTGGVFFTEYNARPYAIRRILADGHIAFFATREKSPQHTAVQINEMAWDPIHKLMWGASRIWITDTTFDKKRMPITRIYTIEFDHHTAYAECTFRFYGLGVSGPNFPTTGLTFDPTEGSHGTLWQHLEDGGASYTPFPITADLGTTGAGEPVYVGGYPGHGLLTGICVSPSGKHMYVSHGLDGYISLHDKWTGQLVANLASGPSTPRRVCRGMEIDYSRPGCPRLLCTESALIGEWSPTLIVTYPITDQ